MKERTGRGFTPQIFIDGQHIGGYEEFMVKDALGEIDALLGIERPPREAPGQGLWDLIIIGGGPAGLTAAVYGARKGLRTLLLTDQLGGQPMLTWGVENYMGYQFITGPELMEKFEEQARRFPIDIEKGQRVSSLELLEQVKLVHTEAGGRFTGRALIIATGKRPRLLGIPGEKEFASCGVSYCATCDGPVFAGQPVMVAGGGNSAMQAALELAGTSPQVHLVSLTELTGDAILIEKVNAAGNIITHLLWQPVKITGSGCVESVVIAAVAAQVTNEAAAVATGAGSQPEKLGAAVAAQVTTGAGAVTAAAGETDAPASGKTREIPVKALFIEIGLDPNTGFTGEAIKLNDRREIVVDAECRTDFLGVFAAGDVTQVRDKQIVVAAGEGAKAALSAQEYLLGLAG